MTVGKRENVSGAQTSICRQIDGDPPVRVVVEVRIVGPFVRHRLHPQPLASSGRAGARPVFSPCPRPEGHPAVACALDGQPDLAGWLIKLGKPSAPGWQVWLNARLRILSARGTP